MKRIKQKIMGVLLLAACAVMIAAASQGTTPQDRDCSVVLLLAPLGLGMIFTRENWLHKS